MSMHESEDDDAIIQDYCHLKLNTLLEKKKNSGTHQPRCEERSHDIKPRAQMQERQNLGSNDPSGLDLILRKVEMDNFTRKTRNLTSASLHDPRDCSKCRRLDGNLKRKEFLRTNIRKLQKDSIDRKIEKHLLEYNPLSMIGSIAADLPKPSMSSKRVWEQFLSPLDEKQ